MKNHPLSTLSFLKPIQSLENDSLGESTKEKENAFQEEAEKGTEKPEKTTRKILSISKKDSKNPKKEETIIDFDTSCEEEIAPAIMPIREIPVLFNPALNEDEITFERIEQNAEKFKASFNEITQNFKDQIKDLSEGLQQSKKRLDLILELSEKQKSSFFSNLFKRRKKADTSFIKSNDKLIPVVKESITSPSQIINSKTLLSYASDWTRTIFSDRVLFKSVPGSGTILLILPKGNIRFIQFNYKNTPIHPVQEDFKSHLTPHKVHEFHHFIDYRNWLYEEMRKI